MIVCQVPIPPAPDPAGNPPFTPVAPLSVLGVVLVLAMLRRRR